MRARVTYAGAEGAFTEEAWRIFLPDHEPIPCPGFEEVAEAVSLGRAQAGMLPLENSSVDEVPGIAALVKGAALIVSSTHELPVRLHLLGLEDAAREDLEVVRSHPVALTQFSASLARLRLKQEPADNTAAAALRLSASGDCTTAVVASERAAALYGLSILSRNVQDQPDNITTFAVVTRPASTP